ncbi:MAG TPA: hypothetical protein VL652_21130 [Kutzneria sp.]|nr:hypothetical protein [Kutzneria sp.]
MLDHAWLYDLVDPDDEVRGRALERRWAAVAERHRDDPMAAFLDYPAPDMALAPLALLFLRWEARYPAEWRARESHPFSPWSIKELILRHFGTSGVPATLREDAADLLHAAILRPYRCKDWMYARLVHHVPAEVFRDRVDDPDPLVSARARFLLHVADHPDRPVKRVSWQRWLDETGLAVRTDVR